MGNRPLSVSKRGKGGNGSKLGAVVAVCQVAALSVYILFSLTFIQAYLSDQYDDELGISLAEGYMIDAVEVFITAPESDMTPDTVASAGGTGFTLSAVTWNPAHDPFRIGTVYTASVTLTVDSLCSFADTLVTAAINGHDAVVTDNTGTQVTLTYTFAATAAPVTSFTAQTAFCTAANNQTPGRVYRVAAPADVATTFTLDTKTTTRTISGVYVTNVDNTPGVIFEYTGANGLLAAATSPDRAVINIPAGFAGDVDVTVHAEKYTSKNVKFTLVVRSVEDTVIDTVIPSVTPWNADIHNAVFVAGDWEWRVLDKGLVAGSNNEALIMSMHTHSTFKSKYSSSKNASGYQSSLVRAHAIGQYGANPVFRWAHSYSVEPDKALWSKSDPGSTVLETISSGTLTKNAGSGYDGCFVLSRNDLSLQARGLTTAGYGSSGNQNTTGEPSRQFTTTDGNPLGDFGGMADNTHIWARSFWNGNSAQELNSNGGWGTGQSDADKTRFYLPAMIIRYNTRIESAVVSITGPEAGMAPNTAATAGAAGYTLSGVTWSPAHNPFQAGIPYTASVTLTAKSGYTFAGQQTKASINGNSAAVSGVTAANATLSYTFIDYSIEENHGPVTGDNAVTITGIDYGPATSVTIGGNPCTITSVAPTGYSLKCTVPAGGFGPADVKIVDEKGRVNVISGGYSYYPVITGVSPDCGPAAGGTGFGAGHDPMGWVTVSGAGFEIPARVPGIDPEYVLDNAQDGWVNPKFTSASATSPENDPFGGVISSTGNTYLSRAAYRLFDKSMTPTSNGNWQVAVSEGQDITATYTLPEGKYVNLKSIKMLNGYYSPVREVEFFAGSDMDGVSLTGIFSTGIEVSTMACTKYDVPVLADDVWTNAITVKIYPPAWLNPGWVSIQELIYGGMCVDLAPLELADWPVCFTMDDITRKSSIGSVTIGGYSCEWELVSDNEIACTPPASSLPGDGEGTVDVVLTTILGADAIVPGGAGASYTYAYDAGGRFAFPYEADDGQDEAAGYAEEPDDEDALAGETGDDVYAGMPGDDTYAGMPGDDTYAGMPGDDAYADGASAESPDGWYAYVDEMSIPKGHMAQKPDGAQGTVFIVQGYIALLLLALLALATRVCLSAIRFHRSRR